MNNRIDAIYARQSVDKQDSISIESQIEFCKYELKGGSCREYTDKGYSGKNTDRPKFQELVRDIKKGLIAKVIVYKLDRISRSILDFATMMELFQQYNVEFVSSTEKFDTSTPMGRAMLNICIVFAQLERETIQKRVTDAYYSRSQRGFKMGGKAPYGFHTEPIKMDGINTKRLVVNPEEAAKANPKIAALQVELLHVDSEIEKLVDSLTGANNVLLSYVNVKIAEQDGHKQELLAQIAELTVEAISPEQVSQISGYLDTWDSVSFDDKRRVVDLMITTVAATSDSLNITWKI